MKIPIKPYEIQIFTTLKSHEKPFEILLNPIRTPLKSNENPKPPRPLLHFSELRSAAADPEPTQNYGKTIGKSIGKWWLNWETIWNYRKIIGKP